VIIAVHHIQDTRFPPYFIPKNFSFRQIQHSLGNRTFVHHRKCPSVSCTRQYAKIFAPPGLLAGWTGGPPFDFRFPFQYRPELVERVGGDAACYLICGEHGTNPPGASIPTPAFRKKREGTGAYCVVRKKRKSGAPTVSERERKDGKAGPPVHPPALTTFRQAGRLNLPRLFHKNS
jgi:hypothetical protein